MSPLPQRRAPLRPLGKAKKKTPKATEEPKKKTTKSEPKPETKSTKGEKKGWRRKS